jgi:glutamyl-tRNA synthetase
MSKCVTRLAPSPTGTLHLGNARTFLITWALARTLGWSIIMRIEDLDVTRIRPGAAERALDTLRWLGLDYDRGPFVQSADLEPYRHAMRILTDLHMTYACSLTRRQIEQASSAPHQGDHELRLPPELRPRDLHPHRFEDERTNYRFIVPDEPVTIDDAIAGRTCHRPFREVGDFVIWTKLGVPAYQLAVVVDDARQGVTDVVRGDDLLASAARQTMLYHALKRPAPRWWHVPLVLGPDGRRLAKRHGDTHLDAYRRAGVSPHRLIGLLAFWSGVSDQRRAMTADEFRAGFQPGRLSRTAVTFTQDDHQWLINTT